MLELLIDDATVDCEDRPSASEPESRDKVALDMDKRLDAMRRDMLEGRDVDMLEYEDLLRVRGDMIVQLSPPRRHV